ncbi:MAG TPA: hypothetical protein VFE16_01275 [Candidatus Cybelea sp.]|nr:hypothetical protein [Candidatus Cybelea sp.]
MRDLILLGRIERLGKCDNRSFAIDMLDRDTGPMLIDVPGAIAVLIIPERKGEAAGIAAARLTDATGQAWQIKWKVEAHDEAARFVGGQVEARQEFPARQQQELGITFAPIRSRRMRRDVRFEHGAIGGREIISVEKAFFEAAAVSDETVRTEFQGLRFIDASLRIDDEHRVWPPPVGEPLTLASRFL